MNKNFMACITGSVGSGKTYSTLSLAEQLDPDFDIRNVAFSPLEVIDLANGKTKELKSGSVIVHDEIQATQGNLDYRQAQAKCYNYFLQTFRHRNFIFFTTSPHFSFINAQTRKLFHCRMETVGIKKNLGLCKLKPYLLQVNQNTGKTYQKFLRASIKGKGTFPLTSISVHLPSAKLIADYEKKKKEFTDRLYKEITEELTQIDEGKTKVRPLTTRQQEIYDFIEANGDLNEMVKRFGIIQQTLKDHIEFINRKISHKNEVIQPKKDGQRIIGYELKTLKPADP